MCDYDLIGLARDGVCPECGQRVADSLSGLRSFQVSHSYAMRLLWGATVTQVCLGLLILGYCVPVFSVCLLLGMTVGWWLVGTEPSVQSAGGTGVLARSARRVRIWAIAGACGLTVQLAANLLLDMTLTSPPLPPSAFRTVVFISAIPVAGVTWAGLRHLREIACMLPVSSLDRPVRWIAPAAAIWALGEVMPLAMLGLPAAAAANRSGGGSIVIGLLCLIPIGWVLGLAIFWVAARANAILHNTLRVPR